MSNLGILKPVLLGASVVATAIVSVGSTAVAQTVEEFYSKHNLTFQVPAAPGGSADFFARAVAPYLKKYLPGHPDVIMQNKPGAGGLVGATFLQNDAPKDGSFISGLLRNNYVDPLLKKDVNFDPRKINSLGSIAKNTSVIYNYGDKPISIEEARTQEVIMAATGAGSGTAVFPRILNKLAGTKFKIVTGYKGSEEAHLAVERGEANGYSTGYTTTLSGTQKQWHDAGKLHYMVVFAHKRLADLPNVPTAFEILDNDEAKAILNFLTAPDEFGRPFAAPGGVPADRLAALREAFAKTAADPDFIGELKKNYGDTVDFVAGAEIDAAASDLMQTPPDLLAKVKAVRSGK